MELDLYFNKVHITNLVELGQQMYLFPDMAYSFLLREDFQNDLAEQEPFLYAKFIKMLEIPEDDIFLFKVSFLFCPYMTFRYRGYKFDDLKQLGEKIILFGPEKDVYFEDILKHKLLSYFLKLQGLKPKLCAEIENIEKLYEDKPNFAYFTLGFKLSGITAIIYKGRPFITPITFFDYVTNDVNITEFAMNFEKDQYVFAWLSYLGYDNILKHYQNLVNLITEKEKLSNDD